MEQAFGLIAKHQTVVCEESTPSVIDFKETQKHNVIEPAHVRFTVNCINEIHLLYNLSRQKANQTTGEARISDPELSGPSTSGTLTHGPTNSKASC